MIDKLPPAQRFMYEYGCFIAFWSNFEILMEVGIFKYSITDAKENCLKINPLEAGKKKKILSEMLDKKGEKEKLASLNKVFDVAERNDWIHGHILNPNKDFSKLTRLRITKDGTSIKVTNTDVNIPISSFKDFYEAFGEFQEVMGLTKEVCNEYIKEIQS